MTEWLDIVDKHDCVIGRDTRPNIHASGAWHRSSHVVLYNSDGEVFVQLRSMNKDSGGGLWDTSAAGHVDSGESYDQCAVRELYEELGVRIDQSSLLRRCKLDPEQRNGFEFTCVYSVCSDQPLMLQTEEIDDGVWMSPADLDRWIASRPEEFTVVFRKIWKQINGQSVK